jgi:regulator of replication initiation timing
MLTDLDEVKSQLGDVVNAQHALAAEQTQIRSAVEQWRQQDIDSTGPADETGSTS